MKTVISIPDPIFQAADSLANRLGVSRSEFYAKAIEAFIEQNKNRDVTARLNQHLKPAISPNTVGAFLLNKPLQKTRYWQYSAGMF
jgi:predicted DNA-binding protein